MKLIFCISNLFIPATLSLISENVGKKIVIYTDQEAIHKFFHRIKLNNVILYYRKPASLSLNVKKSASFFILRRKIKKDLLRYGLAEIYFFHRAFGSLENWLIVKMPSTTRKIYAPITEHLPFDKKNSFKSILGKFQSRIFYHTDVVPLWTGERYIYILSSRYLRKINASTKKNYIDNNYIKKVIEQNLQISKKLEFVLLTGTVIEMNQVSLVEYVSKIDDIITHLSSQKTIAKPHPRQPSRFSTEKDLPVLPHYIPANILFSRFKVFIGYSSTVLMEAANQGLVAISLLDYFEAQSPERKEKYKLYLKQNLDKGEIHFPKNIKEFSSIITSLKNENKEHF